MAVLKYVMMWTDAMELLKYLQTIYIYSSYIYAYNK